MNAKSSKLEEKAKMEFGRQVVMKFEYKILKFQGKGFFTRTIDEMSMERDINGYASDGWEVFKITPLQQELGAFSGFLVTLRRSRSG